MLPAHFYWLNVTPIGDLTGRSFDSTTSGANCVGTPCGNDMNAFFNSNFFGANFTSTANEGQPSDFSMGVNRSEERRVGKECRARWWQYHYKKKTKNKKQCR